VTNKTVITKINIISYIFLVIRRQCTGG